MILMENVDKGIALTKMLSDSGMSVIPKPGTPLESLVAANMILSDTSNDTNGSLDYQGFRLSYHSNDIADAKFDAFIEQISAHVRRHVSFARNVVTPVITAMATAASNQTETVVNAPTMFNIKVKDFPEPMQNDVLMSTVMRESTNSTVYPEQDMKLPEIAPQALYEMMTSGAGTFDEQVKRWAASMGDDFFMEIWNNVFRGSGYNDAKTFAQLVNDSETGLDAALCIFLLTQRLEDEVPEGTEMDLRSYKDTLLQFRKSALETLAAAQRDYDANEKNGMLVTSINPKTLEIGVNGNVYRKWLEAGGSQEVLAGIAISGDFNYGVDSIDERKDALLDLWNRHQVIQQATNRNEAFSIFLRALEESFFAEMNRPYSEEKERFEMNDYQDKVAAIFRDEMKTVSPDDMKDVPGVCMRLVTKARFYYTDSEKILTSMTEAAKCKPDITAAEAALIAVIEYVSDYVADQMSIV